MRYDTYRYLWPPRPETAVPASLLHQYEQMGWWAQPKFDGDLAVVYVEPAPFAGARLTGAVGHDMTPHRRSFAKGRHGPDNDGRWQPGERWQAFADTLPGIGWYAFAGEALHKRGVGVTDTIVLFDVLVCDGEYLVGKTLHWRLELMFGLAGFRTKHNFGEGPLSHWERMPGVWLARDWRGDISSLSWRDAYIEGLVLKDPNAPLQLCARAQANAAWQVKCRHGDHVSF